MLAAADPEGNLLFANERYREFHGLDRGGVQGTSLEPVLDEAAHERLQSRFGRVLDGKRVQFEMDRIRADGKSRRIESLLSPMRDEQGEIVGVVAAIRDITERQQHLDEIRRLSEYRRVVSAVNHRLVSADLDTDVLPEITDVVASSDRFGCTFLALVENGETEFVCHEGTNLGDAEVAAIHTPEYLDRVFEAGTLWIEDVTEPPEDQHVDDPSSHSGVAITIQHDDRRYGVLTVHFPPEQAPRDVEVELLEELAGDIGLALHDRELAQRLATFREIVQRIEDPIMLQDRAGEFEVVNEALAGYADMTPAELQGRDEFAFMDDETATQIANRKDEVVREGEPQTYEVTPRFPTQGDRAFHTTRYPHYDEDGEIDGTVAICRDVTDIRERERQLRVFDRVLRHNLHNEMNIVLGHAETIAESAEGELAAAADRITAAGEELVKLADKERRIVELLERSESCQDVDVCGSLRTVIDDVQEAHPDAAISLDCRADLGATATPCLGDAFREVLENAVIHSEGRAEVAIRVQREGDTVTVEFADNGPGIPEMERQVLEGEEITPLIHGSGLGLWLVSHVVAESGGSLAFHENDPVGSIVEISVPAA
jgi:PAS domain S-box-containing protein